MASIINASSTGSGGIVQTADASGVLQLQNNGTVAINIDTSQNVAIGSATTISKLSIFGTGNQFISAVSSTGGASQVGLNLNPSMTAAEAAANAAQASIYAVDTSYSANIIFATKTSGAIGNSLVERMRISSAGYVTMPNQPMFSTTRTAGSVTGAATAVVILWDNNLVNVGSHYNTATGRFTAPVAGTYYFSAMGMIDTSSVTTADTQLIIMQNGSTISDSNPPMSGSATPQGMGFAASVLVTLAVGDYVDVRFYTGSGSNKFYGSGGRFNNFSGFLVG